MSALDNKYSNNFDALRLIAAVLVIAGHCIPVLGYSEAQLDPLGRLISVDTIAGMAVAMFFCMSGYLVTASFERSHSFKDYIIKRARRLFPGLIVCVLLSLFVVGPLVTSLSTQEYFATPQTWAYLKNAALLHQLYLPGVFANLPLNGVNGSLWTLLAEALMYLSIPALFVLGLLNAQILATLCIVIAFKLWFDPAATEWSRLFFASALPSYQSLRLMFMFWVGAYVYLKRDQFRFSSHIALVLFVLLIATKGLKEQQLIYLIAVPYITFYLGQAALHPFLRNFSRFGDYSYGLYLYGFVVQQLIVYFYVLKMGRMPQASVLFVLSTTGAMACAFASWHLIEKHFLLGVGSRRGGRAASLSVVRS
jgi:peptidoglycan/LPS O-acetylase OafA/YrhL